MTMRRESDMKREEDIRKRMEEENRRAHDESLDVDARARALWYREAFAEVLDEEETGE